jgi:hypothetical protein
MFHVRVNTHRFSVDRGLAVTRTLDGSFIDPQVEPGYTSSHGPADRENLRLSLAKSIGMATFLERGSINPSILSAKRMSEVARYRVQRALPRSVGTLALVGVVDHEDMAFRPAFRLYRDEESASLANYQIQNKYAFSDRIYPGPHVGLAVLAPGSSIVFQHDVGSYFSDVEQIKLTYDPDSANGLVNAKVLDLQ